PCCASLARPHAWLYVRSRSGACGLRLLQETDAAFVLESCYTDEGILGTGEGPVGSSQSQSGSVSRNAAGLA
ncbi:hypothetical protein CSUI_008947, partial [Cystoisospora suis]